MKKLLCLVLSLTLFCFAGCSSDKDTSSASDGNNEIEGIVSSGKFETAQYGIGAFPEEVKAHYKKIVEDYEELHTGENAGEGHEDELHIHDFDDDEVIPYYDVDEKGSYTEIDVSDFRFYYETANEAKGIAVIATDKDVFGFTMGITTKQEIEQKLGDGGVTLNVNEDDMNFLAFPADDMIILRYEYENRELDFYFYENAVVTALIRNTKE